MELGPQESGEHLCLLGPVAYHGGFQVTTAQHRRKLQIPREGLWFLNPQLAEDPGPGNAGTSPDLTPSGLKR